MMFKINGNMRLIMTNDTAPIYIKKMGPREDSRRGFLQLGALGAAAAVTPALFSCATTTEKKKQKTGSEDKDPGFPLANSSRILGTGKFAMTVSSVGLGCMGMSFHRGPAPGRKDLIRLIHQAVDRGVTLFDTAEFYGPFINEELVGEALFGLHSKALISTKFGFDISNGKSQGFKLDNRPTTVRRVAEQSLKRLKVDAIDLFYLHRHDPKVPIEDVAGTVQDLIREGKVKRFGLCEVTANTIRKAHAVQPVTAVQSEYHMMWRGPEQTVFPVLEELGIGFVPYSPLARGFLSGTLNEYSKFDTADNRSGLPRYTAAAMRKNLELVEVLRTFGNPRGITAAQVALGWIGSKKPWIVPIPGTTKLSHLEENLRASDVKFTREEIDDLERSISKVTIVGDRNSAAQKQINEL
jgi:aryl-alcohol dehydrogenase-like predicted oxidoreductase